ncbi:hypothetical protein ACL6C3_23620 [Capilliphycus salinus ALCB114379]|uniref:hypothetical protein n=1 Tax=Capilliphycus salinus TaxID=2768948 RepID=UPI0039A73034
MRVYQFRHIRLGCSKLPLNRTFHSASSIIAQNLRRATGKIEGFAGGAGGDGSWESGVAEKLLTDNSNNW